MNHVKRIWLNLWINNQRIRLRGRIQIKRSARDKKKAKDSQVAAPDRLDDKKWTTGHSCDLDRSPTLRPPKFGKKSMDTCPQPEKNFYFRCFFQKFTAESALSIEICQKCQKRYIFVIYLLLFKKLSTTFCGTSNVVFYWISLSYPISIRCTLFLWYSIKKHNSLKMLIDF